MYGRGFLNWFSKKCGDDSAAFGALCGSAIKQADGAFFFCESDLCLPARLYNDPSLFVAGGGKWGMEKQSNINEAKCLPFLESALAEERVASLPELANTILDVESKTRQQLLAVPLVRRALAHPRSVG